MSRKPILLLLFACMLPLSAQSAEQTLWQDGIDYVAVTELSLAQANNHPYSLAPDKLARILSHLQVSTDDSSNILSASAAGQDLSRVFTEQEIDRLARALSQALAQVQPHQAVLFSISDLRPRYLGDKRLSVSGTVFVSDTRLNLLFGEMHVDLQKKYIRSGASVSNSRFASRAELAQFRLNTGDPAQASEHDWALQTFPGAQAVEGRTDWLSVDLQQQFDYVIKAEQEQAKKNKYLSPEQKSEAEALESRLRRLEAATGVTEPTDVDSSDTLENRLRKLKQLYQNGMIPEPTYLKKLDQIMQEL